MKKRFTPGQAIEFQRDTSFSCTWEAGSYIKPDHEAPGWHHIKAENGSWYFIPSRRIRALVKE